MNEKDKLIKEKLVSMLKVVHEMCEKNKIPYYLLYGTQLGAIRHKGFIPWDDDIDIGIPRPYYQKFIDICNKELSNPYSIDLYKQLNNGEKCYFYYSKVRDNSIKVYEEKYGKAADYSGIWIDVFAIDGIPNNKIEYKIFKLKLNILRTLKAFSQINYIRQMNNRSLIQKTLIKFAKITRIGKIINQEKVMNKVNKILSSNNFNKCKKVGIAYGVYGNKEYMSKEIFGNPTLYEFEGLKVYGIEKYDKYLTNLYGNYMTLPPKEKQVPSHYNEIIIEK